VAERSPSPAPPTESWLTRGVAGVGAASFFSDSGHELATSLLPSLVTLLGAGPGALGLIDGVSDALTGFSKLVGGPLAADQQRRGRLASGGYLGTAVATAAIGACTAVWQIATLRAFAWVSRGLRGPARDMTLVSLVERGQYGRAAGVERSGDNAGAIVGPVLAAILVGVLGVRLSIGLSLVPGMLAAVAITLAVHEARRRVGTAPTAKPGLNVRIRELHRAGLTPRLVPIACFELGNLATTLLILRATRVLEHAGTNPTRAASLAIFLYAAHNAVAAGGSLLAGSLTDRFGPRLVLGCGAASYVVGYGLLAGVQAATAPLVIGFLLSGLGIGFGETAETAAVALALPDALRSQGFGLLGLVQAAGDLGATVVAGALWAATGPTAAFGYAGGWMLFSLLALAVSRRRLQRPDQP
jgi:MFS family permease